jgi:hypothetical protein
MKSQSEIVYLAMVIIALSISISILIYYSSIFSGRISEKRSIYSLEQKSLSLLSNIYIGKLPVIHKTYLQILIDGLDTSLIKGSGNPFYGYVIGSINTTDIAKKYFENYFGDNWYLILVHPKNVNISFGYEKALKASEKISILLPIPIPDEKVGEMILIIPIK